MSHPLDAYIPVCDAIAVLLRPHAEVVLHDLTTMKVVHISNNYSKRRRGDASLIEEDLSSESRDVLGPYGKVNWNGHRLKSVTAVIRDRRRKAIGLLCINHDIEAFAGTLERLTDLVELPPASAAPAALFSQDWRERVNRLIGEFLHARNTTVAGLASAEVDKLLVELNGHGVFEIRKAVPYVASVLRVSRATIYNRLNAARRRPRRSKSTAGESASL